MVHVLMIGGVLVGSVALPALIFATFEGEATMPAATAIVVAAAMIAAAIMFAPAPFSPDYILTMRWLGGIATSYFLFRRR